MKSKLPKSFDRPGYNLDPEDDKEFGWCNDPGYSDVAGLGGETFTLNELTELRDWINGLISWHENNPIKPLSVANEFNAQRGGDVVEFSQIRAAKNS